MISSNFETGQMVKQPATHEQNEFLSMVPKWNHNWESVHDQAVILAPKFGDHFIGRWLLARMKKPYFRLKLDEVGTFVWRRCDGCHTIEDIGEALSEKFGETAKPVYERLGLFFNSLERTKAISWWR